MIETLSILDQLYDVYVNHETYLPKTLNRDQFFNYTDKLIRQGNIFFVLDGEKVVGYTEVWKINFSQFGRLVCGEDIKAAEEDVSTGKLGYVANIWIAPEYRTGFGGMRNVVKEMRRMYYTFTRDVDYHCGQAKRKNAFLIKVFDNRKLKGSKYGRI
jgi:ribosomal protein S18 acetylase RimI-like enzyme